MVITNLVLLKSHLLPHPLPSLSPKFLFSHKPSLCFPISFSICTNSLSYGPSLHKGTTQHQIPQPQNDVVLCEEAFTRVFHLAALRVPSAHCSALENRLRGHLLNWPRIRNIARVPGDDIVSDIAPLLANSANSDTDGDRNGEEEQEGEDLVSLQRRIYGKAEGDGDVLSPVLYREKLARTFNTRGFVKFRNLAKISRPNRNKKKKMEGESGREGEGVKRVGKNGFASVEVVEDEEEEGGLKNMLGEEFGAKKWKGSTRLLLLDERYVDRGMEELPEAIKVAVCFSNT